MDEFIRHLRDEHRLKLNCDYCYRIKHGTLCLHYDPVWRDLFKEHVHLIHEVRKIRL